MYTAILEVLAWVSIIKRVIVAEMPTEIQKSLRLSAMML